MIAVRGLPHTLGSAHFATQVSTQDAECVARLRAAGAVVVGTTTTHEFAYGPTGDVSATGPSRNPHDVTRMSGGSSGGSAVAVAAGLVPLALGTDTGGSVRIPAALCGVVGLKPGYGTVPTAGVFPLSTTLDHVGVLANSAADCALVHHVLAGRPAPTASTHQPVRVGWVRPDALFDTDPAVADLARAAVAGPDVVLGPAEFPEATATHLRELFATIQNSEVFAVHADRVAEHPELFQPEVLDRLRAAENVLGWQYVRALADRDRQRAEVDRLFGGHDLLALPTTPVTTQPLGARQVEINGTTRGVRAALLSLTSVWNVLGLPAVSVPAGQLAGLPVGLQLVARPGQEDLVCAVADQLRRPSAPPSGTSTERQTR